MPEAPKAKEEEHRRIPPKGNEEGERRNEEAVNEDINRKGVRSEAGPLSGICMECCVQLQFHYIVSILITLPEYPRNIPRC